MTKSADNFRVLSYTFGRNGDDCSRVPFLSPDAPGTGPHVSLLIGPNGTRKSRVLSQLIDEFCFVDAIRRQMPVPLRRGTSVSRGLRQRNDDQSHPFAKVEFVVNDKQYEWTRSEGQLTASVNGRPADISKIPFASKALAVAHLPTDRFRFEDRARRTAEGTPRGEFYSYLGLRQATNLTTTGALESKVLQSIIAGQQKPHFNTQIMKWFELLGFDLSMHMLLGFTSHEILDGCETDKFPQILFAAARRRMGLGRTPTMALFLERYGEYIPQVRELVRALRPFFTLSKRPHALLDIPVVFGNTDIAALWSQTSHLHRALNIFESPDLILGKQLVQLEFSWLSSGERQVIGTLTRVLAELERNNLVAIDEPEVSLHPSWQMRYVPTLMSTLSSHPSTHVIIATHSHFMVSDVDAEAASVTVCSNEKYGRVRFESFNGPTYGLSPDNLLYRVFGIGTASNFYLEQDIVEVLHAISGREPLSAPLLKERIKRLERIALSSEDPLGKVIAQAKEILAGAKS